MLNYLSIHFLSSQNVIKQCEIKFQRVFDADGMSGNAIKFEIRENAVANLRFEFREKNRIDDFTTAYTLM